MEQQGTGVIIVAGGSGSRLGGPLPKQFRMLGSLPVLGHAINAFARTLHSTQIVVVLPEGQIDFWKNLAARFDIAKHTCTAGGPQRFHSVRNGLSALPRTVALIAVHDGVRPLVSSDLILKAVECAAAHGTAIPVVEAVDSLRQLTPDGSHPIDRNTLRIVQTPQVFDAELLRRAYELDYSPDFTDDASVVERAGHAVTLCHGERGNLKITTADFRSPKQFFYPEHPVKKIYKYSFSRHTLSLTTIYLTIFLALGIGLYFLYEGGYLSAWFFSFIVALVALMSLSIPRRILVDDEGLHILCLLDITELHPEEIASVRQVEKQELRGYVPYFGGYGFFGFYGHYFDLKNLERVKIYASEWRNFVEITDIYENRIYVSCTQGEELVNDLRELISHARERRAQELQSQETTETR